MNWFFIALVAPALWGVANHVDKYLIEKYFKGGGTGALVIFSSIIGIFVLPFILLFQPNVLDIQAFQALLLISTGIIGIVSVFAYLYAMRRDEASVVMPLVQTIPVFTYILGYIFLKETLTVQQILGSALIILGAVSISLDLSGNLPKLKRGVFFAMLAASFLVALAGLIFKFVAVNADFWIASFWGYVGDTLVGIFLLLFIKSYRLEFVSVFRINKLPILGLNGFSELVNIIGNLCMRFATLLAPLTLVWVVNGFQPFFVFFYGVAITLFFPRFGIENLARKHIAQKIICIVVIFIGTYIIHT